MHSTTYLTSRRIRCAALAWWVDEEGVTSIEYGLMAALITLICIGAFTAYADALADVYQKWADAVLAALP